MEPLAFAKPGENEGLSAEDRAVAALCQPGPPAVYGSACAITKAITAVNWKNYGLPQPRGSLPIGPAVMMVHIASVWVPFTSESKEAIAHYPEIIREITFCMQECGRRLFRSPQPAQPGT